MAAPVDNSRTIQPAIPLNQGEFHFSDLPPEFLQETFLYLNAQDQKCTSLVCRACDDLTADRYFQVSSIVEGMKATIASLPECQRLPQYLKLVEVYESLGEFKNAECLLKTCLGEKAFQIQLPIICKLHKYDKNLTETFLKNTDPLEVVDPLRLQDLSAIQLSNSFVDNLSQKLFPIVEDWIETSIDPEVIARDLVGMAEFFIGQNRLDLASKILNKSFDVIDHLSEGFDSSFQFARLCFKTDNRELALQTLDRINERRQNRPMSDADGHYFETEIYDVYMEEGMVEEALQAYYACEHVRGRVDPFISMLEMCITNRREDKLEELMNSFELHHTFHLYAENKLEKIYEDLLNIEREDLAIILGEKFLENYHEFKNQLTEIETLYSSGEDCLKKYKELYFILNFSSDLQLEQIGRRKDIIVKSIEKTTYHDFLNFINKKRGRDKKTDRFEGCKGLLETGEIKRARDKSRHIKNPFIRIDCQKYIIENRFMGALDGSS